LKDEDSTHYRSLSIHIHIIRGRKRGW